MTETKGVPTLADLERDVRELTAIYKEAQKKTSFARSDETGALNRLNSAQKAFDSAVNSIVTSSPRESDWGRRGDVRLAS